MITILVADDHKNLRKLMALHLTQAGYRVLEAEDGQQAMDMFLQEPIHLLIADIMMPNMDGYELTRQLRGAGYDIPVLMITAKETIQDKQTGFDTGADDYMVKPVDMTEMLLRVRALLRRSHINSEHRLTIGSTILNEESLTITTPDAIFSLPQKEFKLLYTLLSYPGKIFTRQDLMDSIWGYDSMTDSRTVDVHVKRVRDKLAENPDIEIITVRGLGYKAIAKKA